MSDSYCKESGRNLRRDIEVSDAQVDEVGKGIERFKSTGSILDHADDAIEPFGGGLGQVRIDEGRDPGGMLAHRIDEPAQGLQAAVQGRLRPLLEEAFGGPARLVAPEVLELVLQGSGAVDAAVGLLQGFERAPVLARALGGVMQQHPAQPLEQLAVLAAGLPPLFLAHLVDGFVEGLDDVESVQDELGVGTMLPDGADEGLAQIAADPADTSLLEGAQPVPEERVDGLPCLVLADPDDTGTFQVIDQGGVFVAPGVGDLVDTEGSSARGCGAQYADAR